MKNDNQERNLCLAIIILFEIQALSGMSSILTIYTGIQHVDLLTQMEIDPNLLFIVLLITSFLFLTCHEVMLILCTCLCSLYPQNRFGRAILIAIALIYITIFIWKNICF